MTEINDYFDGNVYKSDIFRKKYTIKEDDTVEDCFNRIIDKICHNESDEFKKELFDSLFDNIWRPGGSIIAGANKHDRKMSIFNCSTVKIDEDNLESIYHTRFEAAKMAAHRQGFGVRFDTVRPKNSSINNSAEESEGAVHWMKSFNNIATEVGQKGRKPAMLFCLSITHPDVEEFIDVKNDLKEINNANVSVLITDDFMRALERGDETFETKFVFEDGREFVKEINPQTIFKKIITNAHRQGEPGLQFIDFMKRWSIQEAMGEKYEITATNACGEKPVPNKSVCCLASFNMGNVPGIYEAGFIPFMEKYVPMLVRFMDDVVQYEIDNKYKSPLKDQMLMVEKLREIGLGVTNMHKWLADQGFAYDSVEAVEAVEEFFKNYLYFAFKASCDLAKERGPAPAWSDLSLEELHNNETDYLRFIFGEFPDLEKMYYKSGLRNCSLLSIAPAGSITSTLSSEVWSTGIEPMIGAWYWRKTRINNANYDYYFTLEDITKRMLLEEIKKSDSSTKDEDFKTIENFKPTLDNDGVIGKQILSLIEKYIDTSLIKSAHQIDPFKKVEMMGRVQKWVDAAISVTYNLPEDISVDDVEKLYRDAHKKGLKSITVYRTGSREDIYVFEDPETNRKRILNRGVKFCGERPNQIEFHCAPKRPTDLKCDIHHCAINGEKWIVLIGLFEGVPYEIFCGKKNEDFNISKNIKEGTLIKKRGGKYSLKIDYKNTSVQYDSITSLFMNEEYKTITRMISLALRHGIPYEHITDQLKKTSDFITDFMSVVSRVLNKYNKEFVPTKDYSCPICGEPMIKNSGCEECSSCDFSRCG